MELIEFQMSFDLTPFLKKWFDGTRAPSKREAEEKEAKAKQAKQAKHRSFAVEVAETT